jgi:protein involved in polysaccharide export with SLBB domain
MRITFHKIIMNWSKELAKWGGVTGLLLGTMLMAGCKSAPPASNTGFSDLQSAPGIVVPVSTTVSNNTGLAPVGTNGATGTNSEYVEIFYPGDAVEITVVDLLEPVPPKLDRIKEDGTITLIQNQTFYVAGKNRKQIEQEIHDRYVPNFFPKLTVTFKHQEEKQFYFVDGEVKLPNRFVYLGQMTVLRAIASANGFTDFAKTWAIQLTRANGKEPIIVDARVARSDPKKDLEIHPGDKIYVPRKGILDVGHPN